mmetsp:Transcript_7485/g.13030  ORF Transcript_7485/g.13030 Transcript_7485/m.13030 type:complete len:245 (-) Transcript_7485:208-942(-)
MRVLQLSSHRILGSLNLPNASNSPTMGTYDLALWRGTCRDVSGAVTHNMSPGCHSSCTLTESKAAAVAAAAAAVAADLLALLLACASDRLCCCMRCFRRLYSFPNISLQVELVQASITEFFRAALSEASDVLPFDVTAVALAAAFCSFCLSCSSSFSKYSLCCFWPHPLRMQVRTVAPQRYWLETLSLIIEYLQPSQGLVLFLGCEAFAVPRPLLVPWPLLVARSTRLLLVDDILFITLAGLSM